ncbi:MAG: ABC transporter permease [Oscillospiraceae bacterium]|jgi:ABC-2 type transport system permease protein|nr:ABC transporter permease [Oscillospiraceae bacterium]
MTNATITPVSQRNLKNRVRLGVTIQNAFTLAYRAVLKMLHSPESFADVAFMPIMFTLLFTFVLGGAISGNIPQYLPIIIPGILLQTFVTSCSSAGTQLREDVDKGITNRFQSMPIARIAPLAGILIADLVRYVLAGIIVFIMGAILGYRPAAGIPAMVFSVLLMMVVAWCLSWLFAFIGMIVKSAGTVSMLSMLVMFPLVYLSNALVPAETLPGWLQFFVLHINPLSRVVTAVREMLAFGTIGADFWFSLLGALILLAIFAPLTTIAYKRRA